MTIPLKENQKKKTLGASTPGTQLETTRKGKGGDKKNVPSEKSKSKSRAIAIGGIHNHQHCTRGSVTFLVSGMTKN